MAVYRDRDFGKNDRIQLDGNEFHNCTFNDGCRVVFAGSGGSIVLDNVRFNKFRFVTEEPARTLLGLMSALYKMSPESMELALESIRTGIPIT